MVLLFEKNAVIGLLTIVLLLLEPVGLSISIVARLCVV